MTIVIWPQFRKQKLFEYGQGTKEFISTASSMQKCSDLVGHVL